ncbi:tetratricopeptide repeat protein [Streptomyces mirabilis]
MRGLHGERAATARELLAAVGAEPPAGLAEEYVLCVINALSGESGDPADQRRLARVEDVLADLSRPLRQEQFAGRPTASEESFARSLAGFRATGDRWGLASCLDSLAMFADWRGDHRHALELLDEGLSYVRELAAPEETSVLLRTRATVLLHQGEPVEAREHFSQALTPARTVGPPTRWRVPCGAWATPLGSPETPATGACATKAPWRPAPPTGSAWGRP